MVIKVIILSGGDKENMVIKVIILSGLVIKRPKVIKVIKVIKRPKVIKVIKKMMIKVIKVQLRV